MSVMNAYKRIKQLAILTSSIALGNVLFAYPICQLYLAGNTWALALVLGTGNSIAIILGIIFLRQIPGFRLLPFKELMDERSVIYAKRFLSFSLVMASIGLIVTLYGSLIQSAISGTLGLKYVGFFVVAWTISSKYPVLLLHPFEAYYLPTLVACKDPKDLNTLINLVQRLSIIVITPVIIGVVLFRTSIIEFVYSKEFVQAAQLLLFLLIGDFIKICSWTLDMVVLSRANMKAYFFKELLIQCIFLLGAWIAVNKFGILSGIGVAYIVMYSLNLLILYVLTSNKYKFEIDAVVIRALIVCGTMVGFSGWLYSNEDSYSILWRFCWLFGVVILTAMLITKQERHQAYSYLRTKLKF
jgi:PST family polysaccharide transporter